MCRALHNFSNLKIKLDTATHISYYILIFTQYRQQLPKIQFLKDMTPSRRKVLKLNVGTVNYRELVADLASDRCWISPYFSWKFKISHSTPVSSFWHSRSTLVPRLETMAFSYDLCIFFKYTKLHQVFMNTHTLKT